MTKLPNNNCCDQAAPAPASGSGLSRDFLTERIIAMLAGASSKQLDLIYRFAKALSLNNRL